MKQNFSGPILYTEPVKYKLISQSGKIHPKSFMRDELKATTFNKKPNLKITSRKVVFIKNKKFYQITLYNSGEKKLFVSANIIKLLNI